MQRAVQRATTWASDPSGFMTCSEWPSVSAIFPFSASGAEAARPEPALRAGSPTRVPWPKPTATAATSAPAVNPKNVRCRRRRARRRASSISACSRSASSSTSLESRSAPGGRGGATNGNGRSPFGASEASIVSTMRLNVKIDPHHETDLHQQVAAQIRRAIADGEAKPGERLPPAKDLAAVLGVNRNTVLRALRDLRHEGLLEFRRGRGITVAGTPEQGAVIARAHELLTFARQHGYRPDELIRIIDDLA